MMPICRKPLPRPALSPSAPAMSIAMYELYYFYIFEAAEQAIRGGRAMKSEAYEWREERSYESWQRGEE